MKRSPRHRAQTGSEVPRTKRIKGDSTEKERKYIEETRNW